MKKIIIKTLCALFVLLSFGTFSQSVTIISGFSNADAFTAAEPKKLIVYTANGVNLPTNPIYEWSVANGNIIGVNTLQNCNIEWDNTNNVGANLKSVTVKIKNSSQVIVAEDTKTITVKYIGNVNSIFINGNETGNGGGQVLGCATNNLTVSSSIPDTDPSVSLVYSWSFPSGWSPSTATTTTNSVSVAPNLNGGGNINVSVRRSDGTTSKSANISVSRPQFTSPTVSNYGTLQGVYSGGYFDRVLCGTTTIEVTGGNGTSYDWQTTGGVSANSTTSTSSISASSDGTIKVYPVSACGSAVGTDNYALTNIKTGTPGTPTFLADGDGNSFVNMCAGNSKYLVVNSDRANSFDFQLLNGSASLLYYGGNTASFSASNTGTKPSLIIVMVRVVIQNTSM